MKSFAIVLVCFNRLNGLKRLIKSLENASYDERKDIVLIFSIDNSGEDDVLKFAKSYNWKNGEKIIRTFSERQGLKKHILMCGDYTNDYDIVTVLEDDIVVSDSFYNYAYQASEFYWNDDNIAGISLYNFEKNWLNWIYRFEPMKGEYDSYFLKIAQSWGQVWIERKWKLFKKWYEDNKIFKKTRDIPEYLNEWPKTSWLKYHDRYCIETNRYFVYPYYALSTNCSDAGTHSTHTVNDYQVELQFTKKKYKFPSFDNDAIKYDEYMNRVGLEKYLNIKDGDLIVDIYGTRGEVFKNDKRYILTTKKLEYKKIKIFSLAFRPIEFSIIYNYDANNYGIFLYDTHIKAKNNTNVDFKYILTNYFLRTHDWRRIIKYSIKLTYKEIIGKILRKIKELKR